MNWIEQALAQLQQGGAQGFGAENVNRYAAQPRNSQARAPALMAAYQAYLAKSGRQTDPLVSGQRVSHDAAGGGSISEVAPGTAGAPGINASTNARRGLSFVPVTLPGGQRLHVYYGPNGERTVIRLGKQ